MRNSYEDVFDIGTNGGTDIDLIMRYNLIDEMAHNGHVDLIQINPGTQSYNSVICDFNTVKQTIQQALGVECFFWTQTPLQGVPEFKNTVTTNYNTIKTTRGSPVSTLMRVEKSELNGTAYIRVPSRGW